VFVGLSADQLLSLGFDVDSRNALVTARQYIATLDVELDRESGEFAMRALRNVRDIIAGQSDESLFLEYELVEARTFQKNGKVKEAREKYESLLKRYPKDPRALSQLAEIHLNNEDFEKNAEFLKRAEHISTDFGQLHLDKLIRELRLENQIDPSFLDENTFPDEPRARSDFYRIYSIVLDRAGDPSRAESFIERAIQLNPDKFINHDVKLSLLEGTILREPDEKKRRHLAVAVLKEIEQIEKIFNEAGGIGPRSRSLLNVRRLHMYLINEDYSAFESLTKETFGLVLSCYFDQLTERIIADLIQNVELPQTDFLNLQNHLKQADKPVADFLAKLLTFQFLHKKTLFTEGREFFRETKKQNILNLIAALESKQYAQVVDLLKDDLQFAVPFVLAIKEPVELRRKLVEAFPNDGSVQKEKLYLVLYQEEGDLDKAFEILQQIDLSKLSYIECLPMLKIAQEKKAWDSVVVLLDKLLSHETHKTAAVEIKLHLFTANLNLERYPEVIRIGRAVLENPDEATLLDDRNKESLVVQTAYAFLKRGDSGAENFIKVHAPLLKSFEGKISAEANVYLKCGDAPNALRSIVEAVKLLNHPSPEQYGMLFGMFSQIGNMMPDFTFASLGEVAATSFVKLKEQERWFHIGEEDALDATKVSESNQNYVAFMGKKPGDKIVFVNRYSSERPEYTIEIILPIEKYILWQSTHSAQRLSKEHRWDAMEMIEVPTTEGTIDTKYLVAKLEDLAQKRGEFFNLYCEQNAPLALLALNEGGLSNAIGRIASEQRGFIKASAGSLEELNQQKEVAKKMIAGEAFYLDGTSAVMLSETGLLAKIYAFVPSLKIPQSVISLLLELRDKLEYVPGQAGHTGFAKGKLVFSDIDRSKRETIKTNFETSIRLLETKPENIGIISAANKSNAFCEQQVAPSLSDSCILAQKEGLSVLTEDFLYLKANEIETKKPAPDYCSSLSLVRVLYEEGEVTFEEYLDYFAYLSSYRVRFLPITTEDLERAVLGDGTIKVVRPNQLRKFNFALTLSEEYGVAPRIALQLVSQLMARVLLDDSILPDMVEKIFAEIVSMFPTKENRKSLGRILIRLW
jgi:hypothetical protein